MLNMWAFSGTRGVEFDLCGAMLAYAVMAWVAMGIVSVAIAWIKQEF